MVVAPAAAADQDAMPPIGEGQRVELGRERPAPEGVQLGQQDVRPDAAEGVDEERAASGQIGAAHL